MPLRMQLKIKKINKCDIENYILVLNSLDDKVVSPVEINKICKKLKNSRVIEFKQVKHESLWKKMCIERL